MTKQSPTILDAAAEVPTFRQLQGSLDIDAPFGRTGIQLNMEFWVYGHAHWANKASFLHTQPPFNRLFLFKKNGCQIQHAGKVQKIKPGTFCLLPENYPFCSTYLAGAELFFIHFTASDRSLYRVFSDVDHILELNCPQTAALFAKLCSTDWNASLQTLVGSLILRMIPEDSREKLLVRNTLSQQFGDLFQYLETQPPATVRIATLADTLGMTPSALARKFQRCLGITLKDYIDKRTILQAQKLLISTEYPIAEIAAILGFTDRHYFYHYFSRHNGCTPSHFRQQHHLAASYRKF